MVARLLIVFLFVFSSAGMFAQVEDTVQQSTAHDTALAAIDTNAVGRYTSMADSQSVLLSNHKTVVNDIEQLHTSDKNVWVFLLLVAMLAALTYLKTAFTKDVDELLQSVSNQNLAQQIFRTQSKEISFSSVILNLNFIVVMSLYVHFIWVKYFHVSSPESFSSILLLIFLFTFFYLGKVALVKLIGVLFEANDACEEYIFNFTIVCKTIGLTLLPALFVFYTAPQKFFNFIFVITILIFAFMVLIFVWRGLSTAYKLLYRSVYHFFIYVCVVEISTIFLFFKLLTKTIT